MAKLMLVEDDNNLREIYEARLQAEGYIIVSAKDGEEALVLAKAEKPDLIISDIMMPKISGFEMLDILRNTEGLKEVKVIMLTALGQNDDQQRAERLGADRYLVKSQVTLEDIVKVVHQLLNDEGTPATATDPLPKPVASSPGPETPTATATPSLTIPVTAEPLEAAVPASDVSAVPAQSVTIATDDSPAGQPAAQEESAVESRIEDFVAGASEEPTPPGTMPSGTPPEATSSPSTTLAVEPELSSSDPTTTDPKTTGTTATSDDKASDDKLVSDAAQTLVDSTAPTPVITPTPQTVVPEPEKAPEAENTTAPKTTKTKGGGSVPIAHKKVIEPLDDEPKKDLDVLLALEAANEASTTTPPAATPIIATNDSGLQTPPAPPSIAAAPPAIGTIVSTTEHTETPLATPPSSPVDPNNIAL
jgi:CheY-like chemotaxis protein